MSETKVETYVAFLDVLGFSELISRGDEFEKIFDSYVKTIKEIIANVNPAFTYTIFSDSIIIYGVNTEFSNLLEMCRIVSSIQFRLLMESNVPIKGAISCGKLNHYEAGGGTDRVISGTPIVEAYKYEQEQNWIGVMLTPSVLRQNKGLADRIKIRSGSSVTNDSVYEMVKENWDLLFSCYVTNIPFRNDKEYQGFAIIPHEINCTDPQHVHEDIVTLANRIRELKFEAKDPSVQTKYQKTESYFWSLQKWTNALSSTTAWDKRFRKEEGGKYLIDKR